jgi:aminoglycoside phosphotransferase (APT) family kinase protein
MEVMALRLVEEYTYVPAPLWIDDYEENGNIILIMTQVRGQPLQRVFHRLSYQEREQLSEDLKIVIHQLRRIPNKTPYRFANTLGSALFDYRVGEFGPFTQASDFHKHLIPEYTEAETRRTITPIHSRHHRSFFTHADINWTNILVDQGRLTALVDWECAGHFPEYWEFTKAMYGIINNSAMEKVMRDAFDEDYEDELKVEQTLWNESPFGI